MMDVLSVLSAARLVPVVVLDDAADADALAADVEAESSAKVTYDLTQRQLQAGYVTYLTLLGAETAYNQAVLARVQALARRYGDTVALFQALGGGWWNRREVAAK